MCIRDSPNPKTFPQEALADISARILRDNGAVILQYGQTEGWAPLYESIWQVLKPRGINPIEGGILPLTGSSQGIELFTKLMINPGDVILAEAPTFLGALQTFFSYQANVIGVKMDDNGMDKMCIRDSQGADQKAGAEVGTSLRKASIKRIARAAVRH